MDDEGIPSDPERRLAIAHKIVERAEASGIPREDILIDVLCMTVGAASRAGLITFQTIQRVKADLGLLLSLGGGNVSFGLPNRALLNGVFLAIAAGVNCPIVDVAKVRATVLAADALLGRDEYAVRYIRAHRDGQV